MEKAIEIVEQAEYNFNLAKEGTDFYKHCQSQLFMVKDILRDLKRA